MGCFSFICKNTGKAVMSNSFDGMPVHLFLLKDGKVLEHMYGNYDSYGNVFSNVDKKEKFNWSMNWNSICNLMFNSKPGDGIAAVLAEAYDGVPPTTKSLDDPHQGWPALPDDYDIDGDDDEEFDFNKMKFDRVTEPFHKIC